MHPLRRRGMPDTRVSPWRGQPAGLLEGCSSFRPLLAVSLLVLLRQGAGRSLARQARSITRTRDRGEVNGGAARTGRSLREHERGRAGQARRCPRGL
eukprot:755154-Hanusia_phi.AAC.2